MFGGPVLDIAGDGEDIRGAAELGRTAGRVDDEMKGEGGGEPLTASPAPN